MVGSVFACPDHVLYHHGYHIRDEVVRCIAQNCGHGGLRPELLWYFKKFGCEDIKFWHCAWASLSILLQVPFEEIDVVLNKVLADCPAEVFWLVPAWFSRHWYQALWQCCRKCLRFPVGTRIFEKDGKICTPIHDAFDILILQPGIEKKFGPLQIEILEIGRPEK